MKQIEVLYQQLHKANELSRQKQADIDELVDFIKEKEYNFESKEYHKAQFLIKKHTKK